MATPTVKVQWLLNQLFCNTQSSNQGRPIIMAFLSSYFGSFLFTISCLFSYDFFPWNFVFISENVSCFFLTVWFAFLTGVVIFDVFALRDLLMQLELHGHRTLGMFSVLIFKKLNNRITKKGRNAAFSKGYSNSFWVKIFNIFHISAFFAC